jgi:hypothetical protein
MKQIFLMSMALACSAAAWGQTVPAQTQQTKPDERKASKFSGVPVVGEFQAASEPEGDKVRRQERERRYSATHDPGRIEDPGLLVGGQKEHTAFIFIDTIIVGKPIDPPGIPVTGIHTIVIGTVVSGKCFVAADHTHVYTDYSVKVDQVLRQDPTANLNVGDVVVAAREGGAVHFPSGHVTNILVAGRGLPEIGSQYILFLWKPIPEFPEYEMVPEAGGYQVKNGRVYPLDDVNSQYVGVEAPIFLDEVRKAIAASEGGVRQ